MSSNIVNSDGSVTRVSGGTLWADSPIGTILAYGGATAPAGWFICQGQELTKTEYAELYAVIGDSFGTASVNTKFVLPDLREATTKGVGLTGKSNNHYDSDGVALGEFVEDRVQSHSHVVIDETSSSGLAFRTAGGGGDYGVASTSSNYTNRVSRLLAGNQANGGATTEVKAVGVNFIIKAKQVALPTDLESAVEDAVEEALTWHYTTVVSNGDVAVPSSYNGFYEASVFDAKKHIFHRGLRLGVDVAIGSVQTNYGAVDNDSIVLLENKIRCSRESVAGDYIVAYRPIQAVAIS